MISLKEVFFRIRFCQGLLGSLTVVTLILLVVCPAGCQRPEMGGLLLAPAFERPGVLNIAHRGGALEAPENTIAAFRKALDNGADVLEMDIYASADGVLFVFHDETLDRTTCRSGPVTAMPWAELKTLDAAYHWNPDHLPEPPYRSQGIGIPSLREVFETFPDTPVIVEIKPNDFDLAIALGSMIDRFERWDRTIVASFHQRVINRFRKEFPEALTSAGRSEVRNFYILRMIGLERLMRTPALSYQLPERAGSLNLLGSGMRKALRRRGIDVHVWTINDESDMRRLIRLEIQGIITDRPSLLADILRDHYGGQDRRNGPPSES